MTPFLIRRTIVAALMLGLPLLLAAQTRKLTPAQLRAAAERGDKQAQYQLGIEYNQTDKAESRKWLLLAAKQDVRDAMSPLSTILLAEKDTAEAVRWYTRGAELGDPNCCSMLGVLYHWDLHDKDKSLHYYLMGAKLDNAFCQRQVGKALLEQDAAGAVQWLQKASTGGEVEATILLAQCYVQGRGVARNVQRAIALLQEPAATEHAAQMELGRIYYYGYGQKPNYPEAFKCFSRAMLSATEVDKGQAMGYEYMLGLCHYFGRGTARDYGKAYECFMQCQGTFKPSSRYLAALHFEGKGAEKDMRRAINYYYDWAKYAPKEAPADNAPTVDESVLHHDDAQGDGREFTCKWFDLSPDASMPVMYLGFYSSAAHPGLCVPAFSFVDSRGKLSPRAVQHEQATDYLIVFANGFVIQSQGSVVWWKPRVGDANTNRMLAFFPSKWDSCQFYDTMSFPSMPAERAKAFLHLVTQHDILHIKVDGMEFDIPPHIHTARLFAHVSDKYEAWALQQRQ